MFFALIGGFRGIIIAAATAIIVGGAAHLWNIAVDNPSVINAARKGFVIEAERDALLARIEEIERQRIAAEMARVGLEYELAEMERNAAAQAELAEKEIEEYEKILADEGRSCYLNDADTHWLRYGAVGNPKRPN